jgi:hypothetical protein
MAVYCSRSEEFTEEMEKHAWTVLPTPLSHDHYSPSAVVHKSSLMLVTERNKTVPTLDFNTLKWSTLSGEMQEQRLSADLAVDRETLYVVGGYDDAIDTTHKSVDAYAFATDQYNPVASHMSVERYVAKFAAASEQGACGCGCAFVGACMRVCLCARETEAEPVHVWVRKLAAVPMWYVMRVPLTFSPSLLFFLPTPLHAVVHLHHICRYHHKCLAHKGKLYVFGGGDEAETALRSVVCVVVS